MSIIFEKLEDIRNYLDVEVHPIVSPDRWDVYSALCDMVDDTLVLLKAQEPQILLVEDVRALERVSIWLDVKSTNKYFYKGWALAYAIQNGIEITERLGITNPSGRMYWYKLDDYGKTWRCWNTKPSKEQMEAKPWK